MMVEDYFFIVDMWMIEEMSGLQEAAANDYDCAGQSQMLHNV